MSAKERRPRHSTGPLSWMTAQVRRRATMYSITLEDPDWKLMLLMLAYMEKPVGGCGQMVTQRVLR